MKIIKSDRINKFNFGFTLVELMLACVLTSVIILGLTNFFVDSLKLQKLQEFKMDINEIRGQVFIYLSHPVASVYTKNQPSFGCAKVLPNANCVGPQRITIRDSQDGIFIDGITPNVGFTSKGTTCTTYPSQDCNLKLVVDFIEHCFGCDPRQVLIRGRFQLANQSNIGKELNLNAFDFNIIQSL